MNDLDGDLDPQLQARLRATLRRHAEQITPRDRLGAIQDAVTQPHRRGMPAWLLPLAASLLVFVVGAGIAMIAQSNTPQTTAVAGTAATTQSVSPPGILASETPPTHASTTGATPVPTQAAGNRVEWSAPLYYVATGAGRRPWLLYRDFVRTTLAQDTLTNRVSTAVNLALAGPTAWGPSMPGQESYVEAWQPGTRAAVTVNADRIAVTLSSPGRPGLTAAQQQLAVQSLVWTATAAAQQTVPVDVWLSDGAPVFGNVTAGPYTRPSDWTTVLAPVWVTSPGRFASVWSSPVVVEGQACTFEATVQWELTRNATVVASGHTTASSACPQRGTWRVNLGALEPGTYTFRAWEPRIGEERVLAEHAVTFVVG
ncbi:MAG: Gmad2 immunoglobulin-like domain-containing protein [Candidatus Phosphoribacter sp.]